MRFIQYIILFLVAGTLFSSCVKEPAELDLNIEVEKTEVEAGESVIYTISGKADFLTFYSGLQGASFAEYPAATAISVDAVRSDQFEYTYNNLHETVTATFIASSHGNWGTDSKVSRFDFNITVTDNRTGIASFTMKTGGLFGKSFSGVVNEESSTISVNVDQGTNVSSVTTTIIPESTLAKVYINGEEFVNKSKVDYSQGTVIFEIRGAGGATQDWTILINYV